jgi:mono/diheme cytochrome c family protein
MAHHLQRPVMKHIFVCVAAALLLWGCSQAPEAPVAATPQTLEAGRQVYTANCAACHQADGNGVPNMQPALVDDPVVQGDTTQLIRVVLQGPAAVLPEDRPHYSNMMPPFSRLSDQQIADLLTYLRHDFGHQASPVGVDQVQTIRAQFGS